MVDAAALVCPPRRALLRAMAAVPLIAMTRSARSADPDTGAALAQPGPYAVRSSASEWRDEARKRAIPLRIHRPDGVASAERLPVTLFSHGLGGSREGGTAWGEHWASHGYLCVHIQHAGSDAALWQDRASEADLRSTLQRGINVRAYLDRVHDVRFVLDELARRASAGDADLARADLAKVGMSGHSYGAATTLALMGQRPMAIGPRLDDPRIAAAIAFSPAVGRGAQATPGHFNGITKPLFVVTGTRDADMVGRGVTAENRRAVFDLLAPPDKYLLVLDGADHMVFNGGPRQTKRAAGEADTTRIHAIVKTTTLAFWNAYLRNDARSRSWLAHGVESILASGDTWRSK